MKRNILNSLMLLVILASAVACKSKKAIVKPVANAPAIASGNKAERLTAIRNGQANFSTLAIKAKADLQIDNNANDVSMNIRMVKDKAVWVSVTAVAGLEVARALITPDSVKILNRLENTYIKKPFSYLYGFTNKQINFGTLQSILVGNTISELVSEESELNMQGTSTRLTGLLSSLAYLMQLNERNKVTITSLKDSVAGQSLLVSYADFSSDSGLEMPQSVRINSEAANKKIFIDLKYNKVDLNGNVEMPFNVPKRFSVKD